MDKHFWVYMLASQRHGTLYIGATSDLVKRIGQHKARVVDGFTERYGVDRLVWYEQQGDAYAMATRERQLKKWNRAWKVRLIEQTNLDWNDLYPQIL